MKQEIRVQLESGLRHGYRVPVNSNPRHRHRAPVKNCGRRDVTSAWIVAAAMLGLLAGISQVREAANDDSIGTIAADQKHEREPRVEAVVVELYGSL